MSVKFYLVPKPLKTGEYPVRVSINVKKVRYITTLGFSVDFDAWLPNDKSASKKKTTNFIRSKYKNNSGMSAERMNTIIKTVDAHFSEYENDLRSAVPTVDDLRAELQKALGRDEQPAEVKKSPKGSVNI